MIGIFGTIVLLPIAILALAFGFLRFAVNLIRALTEQALEKAGMRLRRLTVVSR